MTQPAYTWTPTKPPASYPYADLLEAVQLRLTGPQGHDETPASIVTNGLVRPPYDPNWPLRANCLDTPTDLFFPGPGNNPAGPVQHVCLHCSVRIDCLTESILTNEVYGIWGGVGRRVRLDMRKRIWPTRRRYRGSIL